MMRRTLLSIALLLGACSDGESWLDLEAQLAAGSFDAARRPADRRVEREPARAAAWLLHAEAALGRQDPGAAERSLSRAAECPDFDALGAWRARFLRGQIEAFRGRFAAAEGSLTGADPRVWDRAVRAGRASLEHWRGCLRERPAELPRAFTERAARNLERSLRLLAFWEAERERAQAEAQAAQREAGNRSEESIEETREVDGAQSPRPDAGESPELQDLSEAELQDLLQRMQRTLDERRDQRRRSQTGGGADW